MTEILREVPVGTKGVCNCGYTFQKTGPEDYTFDSGRVISEKEMVEEHFPVAFFEKEAH